MGEGGSANRKYFKKEGFASITAKIYGALAPSALLVLTTGPVEDTIFLFESLNKVGF